MKPRPRLPEWLRIALPTSDSFARTRSLLDELKLHTVCESAKCPNHWECWEKGTATFMIAGDRCHPRLWLLRSVQPKPLPLETNEPMARRRGHAPDEVEAHRSSPPVARDDLADAARTISAKTVEAVRELIRAS